MSAETKRKVTTIPADPQASMTESEYRKKHLRVAPYCRVSTKKDDQLPSYESQIEYYTAKIAEQPEWTMVRLYADQGKSGTSTKKRKEFLKLIQDCKHGKIDLVITKSVSRFCRNTLDGLDYIRRLKRMGVGVYFEKENTNTLYMDNEMILTFMMSQAQAESESLSGNVKWGHRKRFQDGKVYYHYANFLGYRQGADGLPEIDPDEAAVVRRIFSRYLLGHSVAQIVRDLEADGVKTVRGNTKWYDGVIRSMLQNEKYMGDALLQKTYIADLFTHQSKKNMGELPKYYVHDCHPAIIDRETFQKVQEMMARRASRKKVSSKAKTELGKYSGKYALSDLLVCGECGSPYRRVTWTREGGKRIVWRCINRLEHGKRVCKKAPTLDESDIHAAVIAAMNEILPSAEVPGARRLHDRLRRLRHLGRGAGIQPRPGFVESAALHHLIYRWQPRKLRPPGAVSPGGLERRTGASGAGEHPAPDAGPGLHSGWDELFHHGRRRLPRHSGRHPGAGRPGL